MERHPETPDFPETPWSGRIAASHRQNATPLEPITDHR
jgi:hypothetical protein